jgi:hypothetical protein
MNTLKNNGNLFLTVTKAGKAKTKAPAGLVSGEVLLPLKLLSS